MPYRESLGFSSGTVTQGLIARVGIPVYKPLRQILSSPTIYGRGIRGLNRPSSRPINWDPLYLFYCHLEWQKAAESGSGWELVHAMKSGDRGTRAFAAELFATTENGRLLSGISAEPGADCARLLELVRPPPQTNYRRGIS